ncbi:MAG: hypothetical protein V7676_03680 [Parasphingorhabdus sp.]|uniref:hypothetical protein n=1 Tax=Parasphingorhabdus sp. TaxID=2709688 RepID=UPI0030039A72
MPRLQPEELEDALFLSMLNKTRSKMGPEFDLIALCEELKIEATKSDLIAFTSDNEGFRGTKNNTLQSIGFTMNAEGRRHALALEKKTRPKNLSERLSEIPFGKGFWEIFKLALAAFLGGLAVSYFGKN